MQLILSFSHVSLFSGPDSDTRKAFNTNAVLQRHFDRTSREKSSILSPQIFVGEQMEVGYSLGVRK